MSEKHEYFTVGNASSIAHPEDGLCIFAGDAPVRNDNGSTSHHLRAPIVTISSIINDREQIAEVLAEVLNENADRFFPSAQSAAQAVADKVRAETIERVIRLVEHGATVAGTVDAVDAINDYRELLLGSLHAMARSLKGDANVAD